MPFSYSDYATAEAVEDAFYEALRNGDLSSLMSLWAEDDDIAVCIHPNGPRLTGIQAVRASWERILENGGLEVQAIQQHCMVGATMAVHNVIEAITIRGAQSAEVIYCYATNVYIKDAEGWRMVIHHAAPASDEAEDPAAASGSGEVLH